MLPVYKGEIQAPNLGMAVEVWNEEGTASLAAAPRHLAWGSRGSTWARASARRELSKATLSERGADWCPSSQV